MTTRGVYTFKDDTQEVHVYVHADNYPAGAVGHLYNAFEFAWRLPRFEAIEFGAAFVAGVKTAYKALMKKIDYKQRFFGGQVFLLGLYRSGFTPDGKLEPASYRIVRDWAYRYEITGPKSVYLPKPYLTDEERREYLHITAFKRNWDDDDDGPGIKIFEGSWSEFVKWAKEE